MTDGSGTDTTAPETAAKAEGQQNADGDFVGSATVSVTATDAGSGIDTIEYAVGADGPWQPYINPVVTDQVGDHLIRYRATDKAGNVAVEKSVAFSVVAPQSDDTTAPETSATVSGEKDEAGNYLTWPRSPSPPRTPAQASTASNTRSAPPVPGSPTPLR